MQLPISPADRDQLTKLHKSAKDKRTADRIKTILLFDKGYTQKEIACILLLDEDTVRNWIKKYQSSSNLSTYFKDNHLAYCGKLNSCQLDQVGKYIRENIITDVKQVITFVKEQFGITYSKSGMNSLLHSLGFTYKQLSLFPTKANVDEQRQFTRMYQDIHNNLQDQEEIVFIDGAHPQHNTKSSKAWIENGTEKYIKTNTGRNRLNLNGAYNPTNQDVIIVEDSTINAQSTIKLFDQIQEKYPQAKCIYTFADNAKYHRSKLVKEYLKDSRIELIYLPAYSPNLNLIERLWKFMRKKVINTTYYPDFESFKMAIRRFFDKIEMYKNELKQFIGDKFQLFDLATNPKITLV